MARRKKVVQLDEYRAKRESQLQLESPEMRTIIFDGASTEFKHFISPELERLLTIKDATKDFKLNLIGLLEKIYAFYHLEPVGTTELVTRINDLVKNG